MANWYLQNGKESDVVISSRVRLARNLKEFRFPNKYSKEEIDYFATYWEGKCYLVPVEECSTEKKEK